MKNIWKHLLLTFLIMGICWGLCLVLSFTGITMKEYKWIYLPWMLGGISPAIASLIFSPVDDSCNDIWRRSGRGRLEIYHLA